MIPLPIIPPPGSIINASLENIPQFIIQLIFVIGIIIAIVFLIYGGIKWVLSGGDKTAVEAARNHIVAAIVGLVIILGSFLIFSLVFQLLGAQNPILGRSLCIPTLKDPFCFPAVAPTPSAGSGQAGTSSVNPSLSPTPAKFPTVSGGSNNSSSSKQNQTDKTKGGL
ncbi:MAG: hypothetical protein Q7R31_01880 [Candidatus Levybacteria bacterium]|nr:hypothetical protein [Candidatus Levybacteria bacterium]